MSIEKILDLSNSIFCIDISDYNNLCRELRKYQEVTFMKPKLPISCSMCYHCKNIYDEQMNVIVNYCDISNVRIRVIDKEPPLWCTKRR